MNKSTNNEENSIQIDIKKEINSLNIEKLNEHQNKIIEYFKQNNISYNDLLQIKQKKFQKVVSQFCDDKKLNGALKHLYKSIINNNKNELSSTSQLSQSSQSSSSSTTKSAYKKFRFSSFMEFV